MTFCRVYKFAVNVLIIFLVYEQFVGKLSAQTYKHGYHFYSRGQYSAAERAFQEALNRTLRVSEKARLHKWLGICQYMLGKRQVSAINFNAALKINPQTTISKSEVLDETVISFFKDIRKEAGISFSNNKALKVSQEQTTILVKTESSQKSGRVFINGVFAGTTNKPIITKPGRISITIILPSGEKISRTIAANQNQFYTIYTTSKSQPPKAQNKSSQKPKEPPVATEIKKENVDSRQKSKKPKLKKRGEKQTRRSQTRRKKATPQRFIKSKTPYKVTGTLSLLPFGVPQFAAGDSTMGAAYGITQGVLGIYSISSWLEGDKIADETNNELARREAARSSMTEEQQQADIQAALAYQSERSEASNAAYDRSILVGGITAIIWAASVFHNQSLPSKKVKRKANLDNRSRDKNKNPLAQWKERPLLYSSQPSAQIQIIPFGPNQITPSLSFALNF